MTSPRPLNDRTGRAGQQGAGRVGGSVVSTNTSITMQRSVVIIGSTICEWPYSAVPESQTLYGKRRKIDQAVILPTSRHVGVIAGPG